MIGRLIWRSRHAAIDAALLQAHTFWTESDNRKLDDVLDLTAKWPSAIAVQLNTDLRGRSIEPHSNTLFLTAAARGARIPRVGPLLLCRRYTGSIISLVTWLSARLCALRSSLRIGAAHSDRHSSLVPAALRFQLQLFAFRAIYAVAASIALARRPASVR